MSSHQLWPQPVNVVRGQNVLYIDPNNFQFTADAASTGPILEAAFQRYLKYCFPWPGASNSQSTLTGLQVILKAPYSEKLVLGTDESYLLSVSSDGNQAVLMAKTVFGALRGLETFSQIVQYNFYTNQYQISTHVIEDAPRFPYRGVMLDTARRFMTVSSIKMVIDNMSFYKLNALHLHLIDTDSWPLEVPGYPNFTLLNAYFPVYNHRYTSMDIESIVQYALERGIRVIPEIDTPGHSYPLCVAYPQYCATYIDNNQTLQGLYPDPSNPALWPFLEDVFSKVAQMFPSDQFHIGSDEMWFGQWQASPAINNFMKKNNWTSIQQVLYYYQRQVIQIMRKLGKLTMGWNPGLDSFPINWANDPSYASYQDVSFTMWTGWGSDWRPSVQQMTQDLGYVILTGPYYVVNPRRENIQYSATWQEMYGTDPWNFTQTDVLKKKYVLGGELCAWDDAAITDSGNVVTALTPYLEAVAETWWSTVQNGTEPDYERFSIQRCRTVVRGIPSNPEAGGDVYPYRCFQEYVYPATQ